VSSLRATSSPLPAANAAGKPCFRVPGGAASFAGRIPRLGDCLGRAARVRQLFRSFSANMPRSTQPNAFTMKVTQVLASGITIRQDIRDAVRAVLFETGFEGWEYATHGGTLFVVNYEGKVYGVTCTHVLKDFSWNQLVVTERRIGTTRAGLKTVGYPSSPRDAAVGTDILDIAVIEFADDVGPGFFGDTAHIIDEKTVRTSSVGDNLQVAGVLKTGTKIEDRTITPQFCVLEFSDQGALSEDPTLRQAIGKYKAPEFGDIVGISGAPVFNLTANALCGMVVRGGMQGDTCTISYIDIFDILKLIQAIHAQETTTYYRKTVVRMVPVKAD
jgi:hypothetical protein